MPLNQIFQSVEFLFPLSVILSLCFFAFAGFFVYRHFYKSYFQTRKALESELKGLKLREKELLEAVNFQQLSVTKIGQAIQSTIANEFELQNASFAESSSEQDRRESVKSNWHKVLELSERLAYFTLRHAPRSEKEQSVDSRLIFAENEAMLNSIVSYKQQQLQYIPRAHALLMLPDGALDKIIRGLIFHASKAADPNTVLALSCDISDNRFNFSIRSWGKGISAQEIHNINLSVRTNPRFHFAKRAQDNEGDLNLASIKRLVMQCGGSVKIASALEYGTTIYVSLPMLACSISHLTTKPTSSAEHELLIEPKQKEATLSSLTLAEQQSLIGNNKHTVLVIDQNESSQIILHRALGQKYQCYACMTPLESMQMIHHLHPSVLLIEQVLIDIESLELIKLIHDNPLTHHIPIIVCCAIAAKSFKVSALRLGASCFIEKPIAPTELQLTIDGLIRQQSLIDEQVGEKLSEYHRQQLDVPEPETVNSDKDKDFITRFNSIMDAHYNDECFTREVAADHMNVCLRTLNRRLSEHYSHNFKEHLKKYRLKKAKNLLTRGYTINEASFEVGFNSASYFSTCFKTEYGFSPSKLVTKYA